MALCAEDDWTSRQSLGGRHHPSASFARFELAVQADLPRSAACVDFRCALARHPVCGGHGARDRLARDHGLASCVRARPSDEARGRGRRGTRGVPGLSGMRNGVPGHTPRGAADPPSLRRAHGGRPPLDRCHGLLRVFPRRSPFCAPRTPGSPPLGSDLSTPCSLSGGTRNDPQVWKPLWKVTGM